MLLWNINKLFANDIKVKDQLAKTQNFEQICLKTTSCLRIWGIHIFGLERKLGHVLEEKNQNFGLLSLLFVWDFS